jgi:exodeoxyribonuclease V beta subunit
MDPFDPIHSPLSGTCLIEAGAGTGKTYTITTLVLRLILQKALLPEQILIVTFTTAATAELRDRVRGRLKDAKKKLQGKSSVDDVINRLLEHVGDRDIALDRLEDALSNFDRMPIFTIHGFCQRILNEMAFETGSSFDAELMTDNTSIIQGLTDDFWRKTWYKSPPELITLALKIMKSPDELAGYYHRHAIPDLRILPDSPDLTPVSCDVFRERCAETRRLWQQCRNDVMALLYTTSLKANIYGSLDRPASSEEFCHKREEKIRSWARLIDRWARSSAPAFPLPEKFVYFTQTKLDASIKKGAQGPQHIFFQACDRLWEETQHMVQAMHEWLIVLRARFFNFMDHELERYKHEKKVLFFDDLLLMLRDALRRDRHGNLKRMLRTRYRAALIDEFQDTDPVQYDIFATLFGSGDNLMFMIGDPKQAIYSFRGADIFTYLHAAQNAERRYTLTKNWRSTPNLVQSVNTLFNQSQRPFVWPEIAFQPALAALDEPSKVRIPDALMPLTIWYVDNPVSPKNLASLNKQTASERICDSLAQEVLRLVVNVRAEEHGVACKDMAVLVRTNRQARMVKKSFAAANIPAVVYNAGSVFHRPEALDLQRVLEAVADPGAEKKLRTALTTRFFGRQGDALDFNEVVPKWWEETIDRFLEYRELWNDGGFIRMFRRLVVQEKVVARLLAGNSGERYFTNILHLSELLHQMSVERGMGMGELVQWLTLQRHQGSDTADAHQIRLESDDDAVTILTIHKSKGLEFPVVFCPFIWEGLGKLAPPARFHDTRHVGRRVLDIGSAEIDQNLGRMQEERMAEELRLLYVAVTRAKNRCYLVWGRLPSAEYSAFTYLMHFHHENRRDSPFVDKLQSMARTFLDCDSTAHRRALEDLAQHSHGTVTVIDMPEKTAVPTTHKIFRVPLDGPRRFTRKRMPVWKIASFSSLIHHRHDDAEIRDDRLGREDTPSERFQVTEPNDTSPSIGDIGRFEASARAGLFFHELFEKMDFTAAISDQWSTLVEDRLRDYGFDLCWKDTIIDVVHKVVDTPLERRGAGQLFALNQVSIDNRLNELEFHLPLCAINATSLGKAFNACRQLAFEGNLPRLMEQLDFKLSGGYLKGYVDLVFRFDGRYFIVDWKSNLLGSTFADYHQTKLADVMQADFYFLQYHIYALALDQYLRSSMPDYSYEEDFGGVFYLFIRGMGAPSDAKAGVFFDRPAPELLQNLHRALVASPPVTSAATSTAKQLNVIHE